MDKLGKFFSSITELNSSTLSGALDVIVIRRKDGSMHCSPFHLRFGKLKILVSSDKTINTLVNGEPCPIKMKLGPSGEGFFVEETQEDIDEDLVTSPIGSPIHSPTISPSEDGLEEQKEDEEFLDTKITSQKIEPKRKGFFSKVIGLFKKDFANLQDDPQVKLSLCGEANEEAFDSLKVSYEEFHDDPWKILNNPNLILKLGNRIYNFQTALPIIISQLAFEKVPDSPTLDAPKKYRKSLILSSELLQLMNLRYGSNDIQFVVHSKLQGYQTLEGKIYLWDDNSRIVISDIDGTITRSDIIGQLMPMVGKDWSHMGVVELYQEIAKNGYKIFYLSSRAIGQTTITKSYLQNLIQNDNLLPDGPLIMSPDGLMTSFLREVVKREPQKLKAKILRDIASLFSDDREPFYAGFGNRETDYIAYCSAGVPKHKIFIIDHSSSVSIVNHTYSVSYPRMKELVNEMFPPVIDTELADPKYSYINFWKDPAPKLIEDDDFN